MFPEKVIIDGLNYAQIIPETLDSEIRLVKFQPTASINQNIQGNQVKFQLQGGGFLDPYSTYLRFTVEAPNLAANEIRFLDRSAHSFISRLYITSNGVECERIEDYHVMAAMINDSLYSSEQNQFHGFEGFAGQQYEISGNTCIPADNMYFVAKTTAGIPYILADPGNAGQGQLTTNYYRRNLSMLHSGCAASTNTFTKVGEPAWFANTTLSGVEYRGNLNAVGQNFLGGGNGDHVTPFNGTVTVTSNNQDQSQMATSQLLTYDYIEDGVPQSRVVYKEYNNGNSTKNLPAGDVVDISIVGNNLIQFCIPLYSSLIGSLQPTRRLIPLHVLPLDVEFTLNQFALYSNLTSAKGGSRQYNMKRFELFSHVLFFFNDIPKAVDEIVTRQGIYFHLSSFYRAPKTVMSSSVPGTAQIQMNFNSINSVHMIFMYTGYYSEAAARCLHFVSHNVEKLQIQNGTFLVPNEAVESIGTGGTAGDNLDNSYTAFLVEYMKAFNRLHDPSVDTGLYANNYCIDDPSIQLRGYDWTLADVYGEEQVYFPIPGVTSQAANFNGSAASQDVENRFLPSLNSDSVGQEGFQKSEQLFYQMLAKQSNVGRCCYAISLEGEQMGEVKTAITGRKAILPFNVLLQGTKSTPNLNSEMYIFLRHDSILHIKPDLSVQLTR